MKFKTTFLAILVGALILSGSLAGCARTVLQGSGNLVTEEMSFSDFNKLDVSHTFQVEVTQGDSYRVSITADDNVVKHLKINQVGNTLNIGLNSGIGFGIIPRSVTLRAEVTMPVLEAIDLSGASRGTASGFSSGSDLDIDVSGASQVDLVNVVAGDVMIDASGATKVTGDLKAEDLNFDASGASTVQLEGSGGNLVAEASGASKMKLAGLTVGDAKINFSGASSGTVNAAGILDVDLSGASNLNYVGEPKMGSIDLSGGSNINNQ